MMRVEQFRGFLYLSVVGVFLLNGAHMNAADIGLAWDPPTNNVDGTPLTDLTGYRVYYGESSGSYPYTVDAGSVAECTLTGLVEGATYYFAATAYNSLGTESVTSEEISLVVPDKTPPVIVAPEVASLSADAGGVAPVPDFAAACTLTDNVSDASQITVSQVPEAGTMIGPGTTVVTVTATDAAGNSTDVALALTVVDDTPPGLVPPGPVDLVADAQDQVAIPDFRSAAAVSDNCSLPGSITLVQSPEAGTLVGIGTTTVMLTATDEAGNVSSVTVDVVVRAMNRAPVVAAGADAVTQLPHADIQLAGTATDDGLPDGSSLTVAWTIVTAPGSVTFGDAASLNTTVTFKEEGTYTLRLTVSDGELSTSDDITVTVKPKARPNPPRNIRATSN